MESAILDAQPNTKNLNLIGRLKSIFVTNYINLRGKSDRLDFLIVFLIAKGFFALALFIQYQVFLSAITNTNTNGSSGMVSIARVVTVFIWTVLLIPLVTCTSRRITSMFDESILPDGSKLSKFVAFGVPVLSAVCTVAPYISLVCAVLCLTLPAGIFGMPKNKTPAPIVAEPETEDTPTNIKVSAANDHNSKAQSIVSRDGAIKYDLSTASTSTSTPVIKANSDKAADDTGG
jgi:uncharacterized membrane protein YhaH (DUF805 family)